MMVSEYIYSDTDTKRIASVSVDEAPLSSGIFSARKLFVLFSSSKINIRIGISGFYCKPTIFEEYGSFVEFYPGAENASDDEKIEIGSDDGSAASSESMETNPNTNANEGGDKSHETSRE